MGLPPSRRRRPASRTRWPRFRVLKNGAYPYIVAERQAEIVGYAHVGPYRTRSAYRFTVENSVYVGRRAAGEGIGRVLLGRLIRECASGPWRQMIAILGNSDNRASIALHQGLGFRLAGTLREAGFKYDQWVDTVLMQRSLRRPAAHHPLELGKSHRAEQMGEKEIDDGAQEDETQEHQRTQP
jgi:phosphinothricin acetyltransferase